MLTNYDTWTNASYTASSATSTANLWPVMPINTATSGQLCVELEVKKSDLNRIDRELDNLEGDMEYFNGQLKEQQAKIELLEEKVSKLETTLTKIETILTSVDGRLSLLEYKVSE